MKELIVIIAIIIFFVIGYFIILKMEKYTSKTGYYKINRPVYKVEKDKKEKEK